MESPDTARMHQTWFQMKDRKPSAARKVRASERRRRGGGGAGVGVGVRPLDGEEREGVRFWGGGGGVVGFLGVWECGGRGLSGRRVATVREGV